MGKRAITRWYIGAWMVWVIALMTWILMRRDASPGATAALVVIVAAGVVTWGMWLLALVKLARQHATVSFVAILWLQLLGLGIVGMVAYAVAGPDEAAGYVTRPSVT